MAVEGRFKDKVAIVTGGARGIGLATAERLVAEGAQVVIADIDEAEGQESAARLGKSGTARFVNCDVSERLDIHNLVAFTLESFSRVDVLVNNAAMVAAAEFLDVTEEDFDRVMAVNLKGAFLCGQTVARQMVEQVEAGEQPGAIVNMSSITAMVAVADQVAYTVSKGGISQLTKVMALALAPHRIRVNAVGPGSINTEMLGSVGGDQAAMERILSRTPLGRVGEPEEIAATASFLASGDASYITGQTIYADGGRLSLNYTVPVS